MNNLTPEAIAASREYLAARECRLTSNTVRRHYVRAIAALEAIGRVQELHQVFYFDVDDRDACESCGEDWPCPTVQVIDGEEKHDAT